MSEGGGVTRFSETYGPGGFLHPPLYLLLLLTAPIEEGKKNLRGGLRNPSSPTTSNTTQVSLNYSSRKREEMLKNNTPLGNSQEDF